MKLFSLKVSLLTLLITQYACNEHKDATPSKVTGVTPTVDTARKQTVSTVLKEWPLEAFLDANHSLEYEGSVNGEIEKYYSNAKSEGSFGDTTLIVFKKHLVLIIANPEDPMKHYAVYDFIPGLIDTSQNMVGLPVFPQARCSFAYSSDEMTNLQSIWKDKLYMVADPEGIAAILDIYDLKNGKVKHIANERESITTVDGLSVRGDSLYFFKINSSAAFKTNDTLYNKEDEYVINLNNLKESKTGKERMVAAD